MAHGKILSLADEDRTEELIELNAAVHEEGPVFRNYIVNDPTLNDPSNHRFLLLDGKIVAGVSLLPHKLRWHETTISAGEIGLVGTLQQYRNRGYCTRLMESWIETMQKQTVPLSFLWGIPGFYERYQFYYGLPHISTAYVSFPRSCTKGWEPTGTLRRAETRDQWWIKKLYRAYNTGLTGSEVRSDERWDWYFRLVSGKQADWWVSEDPMGGYALVASDPPIVWEIAAPSPSSLRNFVLGLFNAYPDLVVLDLYHHPGMPIGRWLYQCGARISSPEDIWQGTWGGMVRLNDPLALLQTMTDKLQSRLENSRFFGHTGTIAFTSEVGGAVIRLDDGAIEIEPVDSKAALHIPAYVLTPLLTGYRGFERFREELRDIPDETADILSVLFPRDLVFVYRLLYANEHFSLEP